MPPWREAQTTATAAQAEHRRRESLVIARWPAGTKPVRRWIAARLTPSAYRTAYRGAGRGAGAPGPELVGGAGGAPGPELVGGDAAAPAPGLGGVVSAPEVGKERTRSSKVVAASTQARMGSVGSQRTPKRVSPLRSQNPAPCRWPPCQPPYGPLGPSSRSSRPHPPRQSRSPRMARRSMRSPSRSGPKGGD
jgi:hypothetical protein